MTITEMMKEHYDEIIKAMKRIYEDSLHIPHCIYCIDMDEEDGTIVTHVFSDNNSWMEGYYRVWTCDNRNFNIFDGDSRSPKQIYKNDVEPLLTEERRKKIMDSFVTEPDSDDYWIYNEALDIVEDEYPDVWHTFREHAIQDIIDCTEPTYFMDILDERIRDNEQYEEMWSDEE